jgi:hypothetical protein
MSESLEPVLDVFSDLVPALLRISTSRNDEIAQRAIDQLKVCFDFLLIVKKQSKTRIV